MGLKTFGIKRSASEEITPECLGIINAYNSQKVQPVTIRMGVHMPFDGLVVPILQTGLAGFAFLLAYLSYRLIAAEQKKDKPNPTMLKSAKQYFYLCILLAVIVGIFPIVRTTMQTVDQEQLAACRDSFDLLSSSKDRAESQADLSQAINAHVAQCAQTIQQLDEASR